MELFTSFDGRISRKTFWLGLLGLILASFVFIFLLGTMFAGSGAVPKIIPLAFSLALLYPMIAISVKRLHDRNKPAMPWIAIFFLPGFISNIMQSFQIDYTVMDVSEMMDAGGMMGMFNMGGQEILLPGKIAMLIGVISMVVGIWALVELGFLRGTEGENNYGPDPLA
jgi:uncharacterized membrane protein YhaH (DUF805 family)